jgi:hypothetical protein
MTTSNIAAWPGFKSVHSVAAHVCLCISVDTQSVYQNSGFHALTIHIRDAKSVQRCPSTPRYDVLDHHPCLARIRPRLGCAQNVVGSYHRVSAMTKVRAANRTDAAQEDLDNDTKRWSGGMAIDCIYSWLALNVRSQCALSIVLSQSLCTPGQQLAPPIV